MHLPTLSSLTSLFSAHLIKCLLPHSYIPHRPHTYKEFNSIDTKRIQYPTQHRPYYHNPPDYHHSPSTSTIDTYKLSPPSNITSHHNPLEVHLHAKLKSRNYLSPLNHTKHPTYTLTLTQYPIRLGHKHYNLTPNTSTKYYI